MSEQAFKEARGQLAFSQSLVDKMKQDQAPQVDSEVSMEAPMEQPVEQVSETPDIASTIKETLTPYMDKIEELVSEKDDEPKEVELKIAGEMTPKENA